jgi:hypothetical protein
MEIHNRGNLVGLLTDAIPDMWYVEGQFTATKTEAGAAFAERAAKLDPRLAMRDQTQAIRAVLRETTPDTDILFLVMGLTGNRLFVPTRHRPTSGAVVLANVPE